MLFKILFGDGSRKTGYDGIIHENRDVATSAARAMFGNGVAITRVGEVSGRVLDMVCPGREEGLALVRGIGIGMAGAWDRPGALNPVAMIESRGRVVLSPYGMSSATGLAEDTVGTALLACGFGTLPDCVWFGGMDGKWARVHPGPVFVIPAGLVFPASRRTCPEGEG